MDPILDIFRVRKPLIAMLHLPALPGRPRHDRAGGVDRIVESLHDDLEILQDAGVDGLLFCNEHDIPYSTSVGIEAATAMAAAIGRLRDEIRLPFGVDLLWDPHAAIAVARATGAAFVREVFTGVFDSDMGVLAPDLGALAGYRHAIGADDVALFSNITPESSRSISARPVAERALGAAYSRVDALLISGPRAGAEVATSDLIEAATAGTGLPVLANTGVNHDNVHDILAIADGLIVGTSLKRGGSTWQPVDRDRTRRMVELVRAHRARPAA